MGYRNGYGFRTMAAMRPRIGQDSAFMGFSQDEITYSRPQHPAFVPAQSFAARARSGWESFKMTMKATFVLPFLSVTRMSGEDRLLLANRKFRESPYPTSSERGKPLPATDEARAELIARGRAMKKASAEALTQRRLANLDRGMPANANLPLYEKVW